MTGILISIPWPTNTGYAMHRAETQFLAVAKRLVGDERRIVFAYKSLEGGHPLSLPDSFRNVVACDFSAGMITQRDLIEKVIRDHGIDVMLGYDLGVSNPW